eukprot:scaffold33027_cov124-Isochrysis_galbana.AAC.5
MSNAKTSAAPMKETRARNTSAECTWTATGAYARWRESSRTVAPGTTKSCMTETPASTPCAPNVQAPIAAIATCAPAPGVEPASICRRCSSACSAAAAAASFLKRRVLASSTYCSLAMCSMGARVPGAMLVSGRERGKRSLLSSANSADSSRRSDSRSLPPRAAGMRTAADCEALLSEPCFRRWRGAGSALWSSGNSSSPAGTGSGATACLLDLRRRGSASGAALGPAARSAGPSGRTSSVMRGWVAKLGPTADHTIGIYKYGSSTRYD